MVTINLEKARTIAHEVRRNNRNVEFAPYDAVVMKQIPGSDHNAAEASRQAIRDKYAVIQNNIDAATTVEELTAIARSIAV